MADKDMIQSTNCVTQLLLTDGLLGCEIVVAIVMVSIDTPYCIIGLCTGRFLAKVAVNLHKNE